MSESVNKGVVRALESGHVTDTSLLANGPAFDDAVDRARDGNWPVGVHLGLVQERPVSSPEAVDSLLTDNGRLPEGYGDFLRCYWFGGMNRAELRREINAQVEKVMDTGLTVTHLDSHQHIHMVPGILGMVMDVVEEYSIRGIRTADEHILNARSWTVPLAVLKGFSKWGKRRLSGRGFRYNDRFRGVLQQKAPDRTRMRTFLNRIQSGVTEFGCHLGVEAIDDDHRIRKERDFPGTFDWMMSDKFGQLLENSPVRTMSWKELVESDHGQ
jgi:predicted glycoside hydrolase/deacetylase ChbG (UPF0249 family)